MKRTLKEGTLVRITATGPGEYVGATATVRVIAGAGYIIELDRDTVPKGSESLVFRFDSEVEPLGPNELQARRRKAPKNGERK